MSKGVRTNISTAGLTIIVKLDRFNDETDIGYNTITYLYFFSFPNDFHAKQYLVNTLEFLNTALF